ncbi:hypothetical protein CCM_03508 [Cordyceps militaris CM01]|uniref:Uncharacterized protein n=1 Tax=Cordyceps militaris (strain CM01) TaxID=983644 RepID=G3JB78_CORMM|nr:uncharacterized protein CCM_03508 [Cordyceps militaris CM01]EGX95236.1 hypothetical protein CCM_03508 [Cordyceps militaris CM01]
MKFVIVVSAALASVAAASKEMLERAKCGPLEFRCESSTRHWYMCSEYNEWLIAGRCPLGTSCRIDKQSGFPYCRPMHKAVEDGQDEI